MTTLLFIAPYVHGSSVGEISVTGTYSVITCGDHIRISAAGLGVSRSDRQASSGVPHDFEVEDVSFAEYKKTLTESRNGIVDLTTIQRQSRKVEIKTNANLGLGG